MDSPFYSDWIDNMNHTFVSGIERSLGRALQKSNVFKVNSQEIQTYLQ